MLYEAFVVWTFWMYTSSVPHLCVRGELSNLSFHDVWVWWMVSGVPSNHALKLRMTFRGHSLEANIFHIHIKGYVVCWKVNSRRHTLCADTGWTFATGKNICLRLKFATGKICCVHLWELSISDFACVVKGRRQYTSQLC